MAGRAGLLELSAGSALLLGGREWTVASVEPGYGRVLLRAGGGGTAAEHPVAGASSRLPGRPGR
jgi:hypothetical protein